MSPFACLEEVSVKLNILYAENLKDLTALSRLRKTSWFALFRTGASTMPSFSPAFSGLEGLEVESNSMLTELGELGTWEVDEGLSIYIRNNAALESIEAIQPLLAPHGQQTSVVVVLEDLPALQSLKGLETKRLRTLDLRNLPLVENLLPLSQLQSVVRMNLSGMPLVKNLQGLSQLETAEVLTIGDCWLGNSGFGMDGLTSLSGLSGLVEVSDVSP